jgi:hypothetical protein
MKEILFIRYAPGSGGNFLISLLQSSNKVACWDISVERAKNTDQFERLYLNWFENCFKGDLSKHLKTEPHHPYNLDFFSSKHQRGDDISEEMFLQLLKDTNNVLFLDNIQNNKLTVMRLNKTIIPKFGKDSWVVNIIIDPLAYKWVHRARQIKLFDHSNGVTTVYEDHPEFLKAKNKKILFNNQYQFQESFFSFAKHRVIKEPVVDIFKNQTVLFEDSSNNSCKQCVVNLSSLLDKNECIGTVIYLFKVLNLGDPNVSLISKCFDHYKKTNIDRIKK